MANVVDSRVLLLLHLRGKQMDQAMQCHAGHDVNKETKYVSEG